MNYLSVCSGIEAATQAWHGLSWEPVAFSEIEKFPSAVLAHHYPNVPNWGDMTKFKEWPDANVDVLVGGTPCQSFSVAGLRAGLADPRGNLALTYLAIAEKYRPTWLVWENVPGVLSADGGRAFGAIIGGMVELGYCPAWRVLDAQYVRTRRYPHAVPQRRRRVFVVAHLGDWRRAAAVLFDRESLSGNPPPTRQQGDLTWWDGRGVAQTLDAVLHKGQMMPEKKRFPVVRIGEKLCSPQTATKKAFAPCAETLITQSANVLAQLRKMNLSIGKMLTENYGRALLRKATPVECERLQGFPDNHTRIPWRGKPADQCPDGPRYKALGNSMATNVMEWLGERIEVVNHD